jgi:hypothetical protein
MILYKFNALNGVSSPASGVYGLNNNRDAVGWIVNPPSGKEAVYCPCIWPHAFVGWTNPTIMTPTTDQSGDPLFKINDAGEIVDHLADGVVRNIQGNVIAPYGNLQQVLGQLIYTTDITNSHYVVGAQVSNNGYIGVSQSLVYNLETGQPFWINSLPGKKSSIATAANMAAGLVIGFSDDHGFLCNWSGGQPSAPKDIGARIYLNDVNDHGIAVGCLAASAPDGNGAPANVQPIWMNLSTDNPQPNLISLPNNYSSGVATAINSSGTIVGDYAKDSWQWYNYNTSVFVSYNQGAAQDLNALSGTHAWEIMEVCDINENGDIAGNALSLSVTEPDGLLAATGCILEAREVIFNPFAPAPGHSPKQMESALGMLFGGVAIGPSGPAIWDNLSAAQREVLLGLATANIAELFKSTEARQHIQRAALEAASAALASLQRRVSSPPAVPLSASQVARRAIRRRLMFPHRVVRRTTAAPRGSH